MKGGESVCGAGQSPIMRHFCSTRASDCAAGLERFGGSAKMAKQTVKRRDWTKEDVRTLKTLAREKTKTSVIARRLKRSVGATYQQASKLGVTLGAPRKKRRA